MRKTAFSGITRLDPGEGLSTDSGAALGRDRDTIDRLLRLGAKTHRHDGSDGLANPAVAPSVTVEASGGRIPSGLSISVGYTFEDLYGGETVLSPVTVVSTAEPLDAPTGTIVATVDYTAGNLLVGTYYYGVTHLDGEGGETPLGNVVSVNRAPGQTNGRVLLSGLTDGIGAAAGYRLYRAINGGSFHFLAEGNSDSFTDDGSVEPDCAIHPPTLNGNTTGSTSLMRVDLPSVPVGVETINVYATVSGSFGGASLLDAFPASDGGSTKTFMSLSFTDASPPSVNQSIGGAQRIDARSDIDYLAWGRPVATVGDLPASGEDGEVVHVLDSGLYAFDEGASVWSAITSPGGSGGPGVWIDIPNPIIFEDDFLTDTITSGAWQNMNGGNNATVNTTPPGTIEAVYEGGSRVLFNTEHAPDLSSAHTAIVACVWVPERADSSSFMALSLSAGASVGGFDINTTLRVFSDMCSLELRGSGLEMDGGNLGDLAMDLNRYYYFVLELNPEGAGTARAALYADDPFRVGGDPILEAAGPGSTAALTAASVGVILEQSDELAPSWWLDKFSLLTVGDVPALARKLTFDGAGVSVSDDAAGNVLVEVTGGDTYLAGDGLELLDGTLSVDGTVIRDNDARGAVAGQVLTWDGAAWAPDDTTGGSGDGGGGVVTVRTGHPPMIDDDFMSDTITSGAWVNFNGGNVASVDTSGTGRIVVGRGTGPHVLSSSSTPFNVVDGKFTALMRVWVGDEGAGPAPDMQYVLGIGADGDFIFYTELLLTKNQVGLWVVHDTSTLDGVTKDATALGLVRNRWYWLRLQINVEGPSVVSGDLLESPDAAPLLHVEDVGTLDGLDATGLTMVLNKISDSEIPWAVDRVMAGIDLGADMDASVLRFDGRGVSVSGDGTGVVTVGFSGAGGGARETLSDSTGLIAPDASGAIDLDAYAGQRIIGLETSVAATVRVYGHPDHRTADAGRAWDGSPEPSASVLLDYTTDGSGLNILAPAVDAHNWENPVADSLYLGVFNHGDGSADVEVDLVVLKTEAAR